MSSQRPVRMLSFDGGGVRGLSSLIILRDLMERLSAKIGMPAASMRPSDYFDLVIGTGTGGISAMFVGRMRMTVDNAIDAYMAMARTAFEFESTTSYSSLPWPQRQRLDGKRLQTAIEDIVQSVLEDPRARLEDPSENPSSCRTAVLGTIEKHAGAPPHVFRSYSGRQPASQFTLAEVACATISTSTAFRPISLGNPPIRFVDAGIAGYNNPVEVGLDEAAKLWPERSVLFVVSLGTGRQRIVAVGEKWKEVAKACTSILNSCEQAHNRVFRTQREAQYFRFNVDIGLDTDVMEWKDTNRNGHIASITAGYMNGAEVDRRLDSCASILSDRVIAVRNVVVDFQQQSKRFLPSHHPAPKIFYGREEYVNSAVDMLLHEEGVSLAILGIGGIGKTAIACTILHNSKVKSRYGDHRRFISCEGASSTSMLADTLCAAFALQPHSNDHQAELIIFLEHAYSSTPLLIILDNFETIWEVESFEVEEFLECLVNISGISLLLTMRGAQLPARVHWTKPLLKIVEPLSPIAAHNTFLEISEKEDDTLIMLLKELGHIPLAITLMAHLAKFEQPSFLFKRWEKEKTRMLSHKRDQSRHKNIDISISMSLESHRMQSSPEALVLLSILALLPDGAPRDDLALIMPRMQDYNDAVMTLLQTGLIHYEYGTTLSLLSPVRLYVLENHPPFKPLLNDLEIFYFNGAHDYAIKLEEENHSTMNRSVLLSAANMEAVLSRSLLEMSHEDEELSLKVQAALDWSIFLEWTSPRDNVIQLAINAIQQQKGHSELHAQCLQRLGNIKQLLSNNEQAQETLLAAKAKFEEIGGHQGAAQCLQSLGDIQRMLNNNEQAQEILSTAKAKFEATGDQLGAAQCLRSLGDIQQMLGNSMQAQEMLSVAKAKFEAIGNQLGTSQCLQTLGNIQKMLGNNEQAQEMLSAAEAKFPAVGNQLGSAQCLQSLGDIQRILGNNERAKEMVSAAKTKFEAIGNQLGIAQCLQSLGDIQRMLGNNEQAQEILLKAEAKFKVIGDQLGAAQCLRSLVDIQRMLGNYQQAQEMLSMAKVKFEVIGNHLGAAQCLQILGNIQRMLGNNKQAQGMLSAAKAKFEAIGNQLGAAQCLQSLGDIQQMLGNNDQAQNMLSVAKAKFEAIGNQLGAVQCLKSLGDIQQVLDNNELAQEMLIAARDKFEAIGNQLGAAQCLQSLGDIQRMLGNSKQAQEMLSVAKAKFEAIGSHLGAAQCLQSLGDIHRMLKNNKWAQEMLSAAAAKFEAIGDQLGVAQCLRSLGDIQRMLGNYNQAQEMLSVAKAKFEAIGNQLGISQCLQILGHTQRMLGNPAQAQEMLSAAKINFEAIGNQLGAIQCTNAIKKISSTFKHNE